MDLQSTDQNKKNIPLSQDPFDDFDFKPITTGLGFHHQKTTDAIPAVREKIPTPQFQSFDLPQKTESAVYQNDLSIFYQPSDKLEKLENIFQDVEPVFSLASTSQRLMAYALDFFFIIIVSVFILFSMATIAEIDVLSAIETYPHEVTPIVSVIFFGLYFMYFSTFEMVSSSTLGKSFVGIKVTDLSGRSPRLLSLMMRTFISILNLATFGLFSYFDLQNKMSSTQVVNS